MRYGPFKIMAFPYILYCIKDTVAVHIRSKSTQSISPEIAHNKDSYGELNIHKYVVLTKVCPLCHSDFSLCFITFSHLHNKT